MFGFVLYIGGCLILAAAVTLVHSLFRPVHSKGDSKSWRVLLIVFVFSVLAPYGYVEVLTRSVAGPMKGAIAAGYADSGLLGPMQYYKVVSYSGDQARVVAVGEEKQDWGGADRPVVAMTLRRTNGKWTADSFNVVYSDRLQKDRSSLPPYW